MSVDTAASELGAIAGEPRTKTSNHAHADTTAAVDEASTKHIKKDRHIIDIRRDREERSLANDIRSGLDVAPGAEKRLPTLLLYDEKGLKLFERITYLDQYYPTNQEIEVLESNADDIARKLQPCSMIVELGSGNLRKVGILLQAIDRLGKEVDYYALDLSLSELERTLSHIPHGAYRHVRCYGLWGTYDDGLEWLKSPQLQRQRKAILSLGSSIGNFPRHDAAAFVSSFANVLEPEDTILVGLDACKDPDRVYHAYNDRDGVTHEFTLNGLKNANRILGEEVFRVDKWEALGEYNVAAGRHQAFVSPLEDTRVLGVPVDAGEKVRIEESHKYDSGESAALWHDASVRELMRWSNKRNDYSLHMMAKVSFAFPTAPEVYARDVAPSWAEWTHLWSLWDGVTRKMLPEEELFSKPIKLRNACIFYLGHIPTFFDMKLADTTDGTPTEPKAYRQIFERGIDPDVDNPSHCHAHSKIPDEWPPVDEILAFQHRVRERVRTLYDSGAVADPAVARCLWLGYEHECMHLETVLYMLLQSNKTLPPPGVPTPAFKDMAKDADQHEVPNEWINVPATDIVLGLDDPETTAGPKRHFSWDVEKPSQQVHVTAFSAKARPITNGEYAKYLFQTGKDKLPASWTEVGATENGVPNGRSNGVDTNGYANGDAPLPNDFLQNKAVRTVYGPVPLEHALHWPVAASYDELAACAAWMGGRIPTLEEARSIYNYVDQTKQAENALGRTIPAVNSHLVNDGVEETPPQNGYTNGTAAVFTAAAANGREADSPLGPQDVYVQLDGCNVGFQNWHPVPVTQHGARLVGHGGMGGLWEWTSSPLVKPKGFEPMKLYPAYSQDFFDDKHNIVLGGSWATAPRLAGRKSFVNWYQRNYPYVLAGARMVRDLE